MPYSLSAAHLPADLPADPREFFTDVRVVELPMTTRFRGITSRQVCLLRGPEGWAEFSPFPEYGPQEAHRWLAAAIEFSLNPHGPAGLLDPGASPSSAPPAKAHEVPPAPAYSGRLSGARVPVNGTVPAVSAEDVPGVLDRFDGVGVFKIKIAEHGAASKDADVARVRAVLAAAPNAKIRLDANGKLSIDEAVAHLRKLITLDGFVQRLEYVEQPVAGVEDMARLRERLQADSELCGIRIAADENIRRSDDPLRVAQLGAADHIVVKAQPLGGVAAAVAIVEACGLPATVSSALESSIGLAAGAQLALALAKLGGQREPWAAGLGTASLLAADVVDHPRRPHGGTISADPMDVSVQLAEDHRAPAEAQEWWRARLAACWKLLREAAAGSVISRAC